jgi:hypothetical protein
LGSLIFRIVLGLIGAALGGAGGYYLYWWLLNDGLNFLVLPGAMIGLGCGLFSLRRSRSLALVCAVVALGFGIYCEWSHAPFRKDESLTFFVTHVHWLGPVKIILIFLGGLTAYWLGQTSAFQYWKETQSRPNPQPPTEQ